MSVSRAPCYAIQFAYLRPAIRTRPGSPQLEVPVETEVVGRRGVGVQRVPHGRQTRVRGVRVSQEQLMVGVFQKLEGTHVQARSVQLGGLLFGLVLSGAIGASCVGDEGVFERCTRCQQRRAVVGPYHQRGRIALGGNFVSTLYALHVKR